MKAVPRLFELVSEARPTAKSGWAAAYVRQLRITDAVAIVGSVSVAQVARFGTDGATLKSHLLVQDYWLVSVMLMVAWLGVLSLFHSREPRAVGSGVEEYRRIVHASTALF
ncbi:MAG: sugar transferase, partial [Propionibacteriaceae bacterium]|nr:sugar transferase [Propionibacteriaceae bacterium]